MFSYYGSKSKIVHLYPPPKYGKIIEPFAGSARYSLKYWDREVVLVDAYKVITDTWKYLQGCSKNDILNLPILNVGETLDDFKLSAEEKMFLGFIVQAGTTGQRKTVSHRGKSYMKTQLRQIAEQLHKIKSWTIINGSYKDIGNEIATWFIDPPYQFGGHEYIYSNSDIDFTRLADWCRSRTGQAIVCENTKASWMEFMPVSKLSGSLFTTTEAIWTNMPTSFMPAPKTLFP